MLDEGAVRGVDGRAGRVLRHLGPEDRVVLGQGVLPLDLDPRRGLTGDRVEEDGLLDGRHHRVADPAHHRVVGPHHERVLAPLGEAARVVKGPRLHVEAGVGGDGRRERGVHAPPSALHVGEGDHGMRRRVRAVGAHPEERVEDLRGRVRVERHHHSRDAVEVAIEEGGDPLAVLDRASTRAPAHEELAFRQAERVLHVHEKERHAAGVLRGRPDPVGHRPLAGLGRTLLVGHAVDPAHGRGVEERGQGKAHRCCFRPRAGGSPGPTAAWGGRACSWRAWTPPRRPRPRSAGPASPASGRRGGRSPARRPPRPRPASGRS